MRKLLALVMVVLLGVVLLAVAGCSGGDTKTAQQDLKTADAAFTAWQNSLTQLTNSLTPIFGGALSGNYSAVTQANLQAADTQVKAALQQSSSVTAEYAKVDSLKGVDDYKAYADAMRKVISTNEQLLKQGEGLVQALLPLAGDQAAIGQWFTANSSMLTQLQDASNSATKAYSDAQQIKKDKNLSW